MNNQNYWKEIKNSIFGADCVCFATSRCRVACSWWERGGWRGIAESVVQHCHEILTFGIVWISRNGGRATLTNGDGFGLLGNNDGVWRIYRFSDCFFHQNFDIFSFSFTTSDSDSSNAFDGNRQNATMTCSGQWSLSHSPSNMLLMHFSLNRYFLRKNSNYHMSSEQKLKR